MISLRGPLATESGLGFVGAEAIAFGLALSHPGLALPCVRTIARILAGNGWIEQSRLADPLWPHRLVRGEGNVATLRLRIFRLRSKAPERQPLIMQFLLTGSIRRASITTTQSTSRTTTTKSPRLCASSSPSSIIPIAGSGYSIILQATFGPPF